MRDKFCAAPAFYCLQTTILGITSTPYKTIPEKSLPKNPSRKIPPEKSLPKNPSRKIPPEKHPEKFLRENFCAGDLLLPHPFHIFVSARRHAAAKHITNVLVTYLSRSNFATLTNRKECNKDAPWTYVSSRRQAFWPAMCMVRVSRGLSVLLISIGGSEGLSVDKSMRQPTFLWLSITTTRAT